MTENLTELQKSALNFVRFHYRGNEITGRDIAMQIGLRPRDTGKEGADLRSIINALRKRGYPVCANGKGYFYPKSKKEICEYVESLRGRIKKEQEALDGLIQCLSQLEEREEVIDPLQMETPILI